MDEMARSLNRAIIRFKTWIVSTDIAKLLVNNCTCSDRGRTGVFLILTISLTRMIVQLEIYHFKLN